jgi:MFS family permease
MLFGAPVLGYWGDRFGRRQAIIWGTLIYGLSTLEMLLQQQNAGWYCPLAFLGSIPRFWAKVILINLVRPLDVHQVVLRSMAACGFGQAVNIAFDAGRIGASGETV